MAEPRVSVVMSVRDDLQRLPVAVASILSQDFRELELIVVDDGSRDGSGELLDRLAAEDPRLRVLHRENRGLTQALVEGCELARGEFIARQDSDDRSRPGRIAAQVAALDRDARVGFVSCTTAYVGPQGEALLEISRPADPQAATQELLHGRKGPGAHGSVMFRRSLYQDVGGYRPAFRYAQDSDLWLRMAEKAMFACVPEVLYEHRKEVSSTSGAHRPAQKRFGELGHLCRQARAQGTPETPYLEEAARLSAQVATSPGREDRAAAAAAAYLLGSQLLRNGNPRARQYLWQAVRLYPWHWRAWLRLAQGSVQGGSAR
jgi:glycosyltransferase involved in cell wall biosynthesis